MRYPNASRGHGLKARYLDDLKEVEVAKMGEHLAVKYTNGLFRAADKVAGTGGKGKLVPTARKKLASKIVDTGMDPASITSALDYSKPGLTGAIPMPRLVGKSDMLLKPTEFERGAGHEQRSGEHKRRKIVAGQLAYQGTAAAAGTAATAVGGAKLAGTGIGQHYLKTSEKKYRLSGNHEAADTLKHIAAIGRKVKKKPVLGTAAGLATAGVAAGAATMSRLRSNEEAGISQGIGRLKAGQQYNTDLQRVKKNFRLMASLLSEIDRGSPNIQRARRLVKKHPQAIIGTTAGTAAVGAGALGVKTRRDYKRDMEQTRQELSKADREPLKTHISEADAKKLVDRHGLKGPLPKGLDRQQKMAAYEARYVSAGGKKAEHWDRRARTADKVKVGGLGVATAGGAAWLATRAKGYKSLKAIRAMPIGRHAENAAALGATAGGAGELYAGHARRKRASYASAPAGVAASALRRMQAYTP